MGYVESIRKKIGHDPLLLVGASVIVENGAGELLLQRRADDGSWGYAGGCVELYEDVQAAARRELYEETGLVAGEMRLLGVFSGERLRHVYPNGDQASIVDCVYVCKDYSGTLSARDGEALELRFFAKDALPETLSPTVRPALEAYLQEGKSQ